jgi:hypothetical protein
MNFCFLLKFHEFFIDRFPFIHKNKHKENMKFELKTFQFALNMFQKYIFYQVTWRIT